MPKLDLFTSGLPKRKLFFALLIALFFVLLSMYGKYGATFALPNNLEAKTSHSQNEAASLETDNINSVNFIKLSHEGFFYDRDINVVVSFTMKNINDYTVLYTTDGTEPKKDGDSYNGTLYTRSIRMLEPDTNSVNGTCLKVKVYYTKNGLEYETATLTHTYFISKSIDSRFDTLVFSISTDPYNIYDYDYGIFVPGRIRDEFRAANPDVEPIPTVPANYNLRGRESERPIYIEVFEPDGTRVIAQGAGMRVTGGWSRGFPQKSLRLIARKIYEPTLGLGRFHYNFFEGAVSASAYPVASAYNSYDEIILRNGANDHGHGFIRNELSSSCAILAGFPDASYCRPVSIFLNGEYYGFSWMHERYSPEYLQQNYQAPDTDFTIITFFENDEDNNYHSELNSGLPSSLEEFSAFYEYRDKNFRDDEIYEEFCKLVDIDNLTLYYAIQCFIDNRDWPNNNMKVWKYHGENGGTNQYLDGKWRFLLYDIEYSWGLYDGQYSNRTLDRLLGGGGYTGGGSSLLTALMKRPEYAEKFINTLCDLANDSFSYETTVDVINRLAAMQENEISYAFSELNNYSDPGNRLRNHEVIKYFALNRPWFMYEHIKELFPNLKSTYVVTVEGAEGMSTKLNTIPINGEITKLSEYFTGFSVMLTTIEDSDAYKFSHWLINGEKVTDKNVLLSYSMCENGRVNIKLVAEKYELLPIMIDEVYESGSNDWVKIYNNSDDYISLSGLFLSDNIFDPKKWEFPYIEIQPRGELLLLGEANSLEFDSAGIFLSFNLSEHEILFLSDSSGRILSQLRIPDLNASRLYKFDFDDGLYHIIPY